MSISRAVILVCTIVALAHATAASAAPITLQLVSGASVVTVTDGGVGDADPTDGAVTYIGSVGSWSLNVSSGFGYDVLGPATMALSSVSVAPAGAAAPLTVWLTQTDLTTAVSGFLMEFHGTGANLASALYSAYADDSNAAFGLSQLIGTLGPFTPPPSFSGSTSGLVSVTGPYSLTQVFTITGGRSGHPTTYNGDGQLTGIPSTDVHPEQVPEPASLTLFGGGLGTIAMWLRRRRDVRA